MVYKHEFNRLDVQTADLLCMTDGDQDDLQGQFWRLLGTLLPGPIDHIVIYIGPGGRCIEAGPQGVTAYEMVGSTWFAKPLARQRGRLHDQLDEKKREWGSLLSEIKIIFKTDVTYFDIL